MVPKNAKSAKIVNRLQPKDPVSQKDETQPYLPTTLTPSLPLSLRDSPSSEPFLISIWNMQGQRSGIGSAKQTAILSLFKDTPQLDMMLLQEAGNLESDTALGCKGKSVLEITINVKYETGKGNVFEEHTVPVDVKHVLVESNRGYRDVLGVIWYGTRENMDASNPRCSMAVVYRFKRWFEGTPVNSPELRDLLRGILYAKSYIDKNSNVPYAEQAKNLRPAFGIKHPSGTVVYNFHAPSCSNRFPVKVSFEILSEICHGPAVLAGDLNFEPQVLVHMESKAREANVSPFHFDCSNEPTHSGGRRLDLAMGNRKIRHVPMQGLYMKNHELEKFLLTRIDNKIANQNDLQTLKQWIAGRMDSQAQHELINTSLSHSEKEEIRSKSKAWEEETSQIKKEAYTGFQNEITRDLNSDHTPQFFLISPPPPPVSPIAMEDELLKTYPPILNLIESVKGN